jgi:hypothetical protein
VKLNADVATAFGVFLNGVDIISTIPSNANDGAVANDDAGKIGATLAIISTSDKGEASIVNGPVPE